MAVHRRSALLFAASSGIVLTIGGDAFAEVKVTTVEKVENVDLKPPRAAGDVNVVRLKVPGIDAFTSIKLSETPSGESGKQYTMKNEGTRDIVLWNYHAYRSGNGQVSFYPKEMTRLEPGKDTKASLNFRAENGKLSGSYRMILIAVDYERWGNIPNQWRTEAGKKVDDMKRALDERMEAAKDSYK